MILEILNNMEVNNTSQPVISPEPIPQPQPVLPPVRNNKGFFLIILGIVAILLIIGSGAYYLLGTQKEIAINSKENSPTSTPTTQNTPTPTADPMATWKTFTLEGITFKYPPDWKDPEYINMPAGRSAEIRHQNDTQRIIVLSGVNKGSTEQELSEFINTLVQGGAERLTLDGSEAAKGKVTYQGAKTTTVYVTAKDKTSQYSISLQVAESVSDQEIDNLLNQIFSTFKFKN